MKYPLGRWHLIPYIDITRPEITFSHCEVRSLGPYMIKIIVLVPLILSLLWFGYLQANKYSLEQGKQGFLYILVLSGVIALFYTVMIFLTH
jgi:hypothetical protein